MEAMQRKSASSRYPRPRGITPMLQFGQLRVCGGSRVVARVDGSSDARAKMSILNGTKRLSGGYRIGRQRLGVGGHAYVMINSAGVEISPCNIERSLHIPYTAKRFQSEDFAAND
jgi:hypothetical protein